MRTCLTKTGWSVDRIYKASTSDLTLYLWQDQQEKDKSEKAHRLHDAHGNDHEHQSLAFTFGEGPAGAGSDIPQFAVADGICFTAKRHFNSMGLVLPMGPAVKGNVRNRYLDLMVSNEDAMTTIYVSLNNWLYFFRLTKNGYWTEPAVPCNSCRFLQLVKYADGVMAIIRLNAP